MKLPKRSKEKRDAQWARMDEKVTPHLKWAEVPGSYYGDMYCWPNARARRAIRRLEYWQAKNGGVPIINPFTKR